MKNHKSSTFEKKNLLKVVNFKKWPFQYEICKRLWKIARKICGKSKSAEQKGKRENQMIENKQVYSIRNKKTKDLNKTKGERTTRI